MVLQSGALDIKIFRRKAELQDVGSASVHGENIPLDIPKKTRLYVEQADREREEAVEMHRIFQRDLCKLRLSSARAYVKLVVSGSSSTILLDFN